MKLDEYQRLKEAAEKKKQASERAKGALEGAMARLKDEFGCATLKEAKAKLLKLQEREQEIGSELESRIKAFTKKWKTLLDS